jgi:MoaA/NifB/PqqE/SkfB family radical SAM enzyme
MLKNVTKLIKDNLSILKKCFKYNLESLVNRNPYPKLLVFYATFRCNSKCKACDIWKGNDEIKKKTELTIEQIDNFFLIKQEKL